VEEKEIRFTFKKWERLRKKKEFQSVFESGRKTAGKLLVLVYKENELGFPRAGFIVSKKVSKKAVERNRAKRLMRETFRLNKHLLKPFDIIFIAKKEILGKKRQDVEKDFLSIASRSGLLDEKRVDKDN